MSSASNKRRWADPAYRARMLVQLAEARNQPEHPFDKAVRSYRISKAQRTRKAGR